MFYPHDKNDIRKFTPEALRGLPNPPVFHLRAGTVRDKNHFTRLLIEEGAQRYDLEDMRAETIVGLKELGGEQAFAEWEPRIKAFWDALDDHEKEAAEIIKSADAGQEPELPPFDYDDAAAVTAILQSIDDNWKPVRKMRADNVLANRMQPVIMAQIIITDVENLDVTLQRDGKYLTFECAGEVRDELQELARVNGADVDAVMTELNREVLQRLFTPKSAEKNSASPSPSSSDQTSLKPGTEAKEDGTSTASETSTETPENS